LILHYKRLKEPEIRNVFITNMERLRLAEQQYALSSGAKPLFVVESEVLQFVSDHCAKHPGGKGAWNGRQIRNAFVIATGIARDEAEQQNSPDFQPQLRYSHFKTVESLFDDYVEFRHTVLGKDDAGIALLKEERNDDYDGPYEEEKKAHPWASMPMHNRGHQYQRMPYGGQPAFQAQDLTRPHMSVGAGYLAPTHGYEVRQRPDWRLNDEGMEQGYGITPRGSAGPHDR
jgi:hypothetical protein